MASGTFTVRMRFANAKAVRAFGKVLKTLEDVSGDFGYRDDVKEAVKAARYARKHLVCATDKE